MRQAGHVARTGEMRNAYNNVVGKHEGKNHLEELSIDGKMLLEKIFLNETGWGADWIHLAQDRDQWRALVNTEMNLEFPYKAGNF
jgi:hypothetical protein